MLCWFGEELNGHYVIVLMGRVMDYSPKAADYSEDAIGKKPKAA